MSEAQTAGAATTTTTEEAGLGLLDQVIGATKQTERDRAQELIKALTEEALKGTVTYSRNLSQTFDRAITALDQKISTHCERRSFLIRTHQSKSSSSDQM